MTDDAASYRLGTPVAVHVIPPRPYSLKTLGYRFECSFEHFDVHPEGRKIRIRISPCLENYSLTGVEAVQVESDKVDKATIASYVLSRITRIRVSLAVDLLPETGAIGPPRLNFAPPSSGRFPSLPQRNSARAEDVSLWDDSVDFNEHYSAFSLVYSHRTRKSNRIDVGAIRCRIVASASRHAKVGGLGGAPEVWTVADAATVWFDRGYRLPKEASA